MNTINIKIPFGELVDRITILELKQEHADKDTFNLLEREVGPLKKKYVDFVITLDDNVQKDLSDAFSKLYNTNRKLWDIEDRLRVLEKDHNFGEEFVSLARDVYKTNDLRSEYKGLINLFTNSDLNEVKIFSTDG